MVRLSCHFAGRCDRITRRARSTHLEKKAQDYSQAQQRVMDACTNTIQTLLQAMEGVFDCRAKFSVFTSL